MAAAAYRAGNVGSRNGTRNPQLLATAPDMSNQREPKRSSSLPANHANIIGNAEKVAARAPTARGFAPSRSASRASSTRPARAPTKLIKARTKAKLIGVIFMSNMNRAAWLMRALLHHTDIAEGRVRADSAENIACSGQGKECSPFGARRPPPP